tara:strand:- start:2371 stop:3756 length:1386 start_codon:yes stop_codon:yes gene_type:complete
MELSKIIQSRYKTKTYEELAQRVSNFVGQTVDDKKIYEELILRKRFIPAGNTLLAGINPIRPNCVIFESINENNYDELSKRAENLWRNRIGIGFDFSNANDPVLILKRLSKLNASIDLGHRPQRGNMGVLRDDHPKIKEFIKCKSQTNKIYNFNLSIAITKYDNEIMKMISESAHITGDPGIIFLNKVQEITGATKKDLKIIQNIIGKIETVVPCGEQSMFANESCNLGSINLACPDYWNDKTFLETIFIDSVRKSVRFLDDVIDLCQIPDEKIREQNLNTRRIGLGIMGWADALKNINVKYGSEESFQLVDKVGKLFKQYSHDESENLGKIKGIAPILKNTSLKRRNIQITCIAPTGGITILVGNKGFGIEPLFTEAGDIPIQTHLDMQSKWQKYVDNCISKTVNMPNSSSVEDILEVWKISQEKQLKSVTIYRDGSHSDQPLQVGIKTKTDCPKGNCSL